MRAACVGFSALLALPLTHHHHARTLVAETMPRNSQGNHYSTPGGTNSSSGSSYHYSNTNGSCASILTRLYVQTCLRPLSVRAPRPADYYANDNGSTYYNSGKGQSTYTSPSGHTTTSSSGSSSKR